MDYKDKTREELIEEIEELKRNNKSNGRAVQKDESFNSIPPGFEYYLKSILEAVPSPACFRDNKGNFRFCNKAFDHLVFISKKPEELSEEIDSSHIGQLQETEYTDFIERFYLDTPGPYETKIIVPDNDDTFDFVIHQSPIAGPDGSDIGNLVIMYDMTEQNRAKESLNKSEKKFRKIVENSPLGIILYELDDYDRLIFKEANKSAGKILGADLASFTGKSIDAVFPEIKNTGLPQIYKEICKYGNSWMTDRIDYEDENISGAYKVYAFQTSPGQIAVKFSDITEQKRMENDLRKSESLFRGIFNQTYQFMGITDNNGILIDTNDAVIDLIGVPKDKVLGHYIWDTEWWNHSETEKNKIKKSYKQALKGNLVKIETTHISKHGRLRYIDFSFKPLFDENNQIKYLIAEGRDITDIREAEKSLKDFNSKLQSILDTIPVRVFWKDINSIYLGCNRLFTEDTEYQTPDEIIGKTDHDMPWNDRADLLIKDDKEIISSGIARYNYEEEANYHVEGITWLRKSKIPLHNAEGDAIGVLGIYQDITEEKRIINELITSEARFRDLANLLPQAVYEIDLEGNIIYSNRCGFEMFGYREDDIKNGMNVFDIIIESEHELLKENLERSVHDTNNTGNEYTALTKDGQQIPILEYNNVIFENGQPVGFRGIAINLTERNESQKKIIESEEKYRNLVENINEVIFSTDEYGIITYISPSIVAVTGYTPRDLIGKHFSDFIYKDDLEKIIGQFESLKVNKNEPDEYRVYNKDDHFRWVYSSSQPVFREGKFKGITGIISDIHRRKQAEQDLIESNNRLSLVINATNDGVWDWNLKTGKLYFSPRYYSMLGYETDEFEATYENWLNLFHPDDKEKSEIIIDEHLKNQNESLEMEFRMRHKSGSWIWIYSRGKVVSWDDEGRPERIVGSHMDITGRKNDQEALQESENRLRTIFEAAKDVSFITIDNNFDDPKIIEFSPGAENIFGYSKDEMINKPVKILYPEDSEIDFTKMTLQIQDLDHRYRSELILVRKSGEKFPALFTSYPLFDSSGNITKILGISLDISELKKAEEEIKELNDKLEQKVSERTAELHEALEHLEKSNYELKELNWAVAEESQKLVVLNDKLAKSEKKLRENNASKDKFFSIIAHDLKNPLQTLLLSAELLKKYFYGGHNNKLQGQIEKISKTTFNLKSLLDNLLDWSRTQLGRFDFTPSPISLNELIESNIELALSSATEKNQAIQNESFPDVKVFADKNMLNTVLRNLLFNAIKFTPSGGKINCSVLEMDHYAMISISDNGIGMTSDETDKLFRIDVHHTTPGTLKEKGTGLGLIICKEFIEKHGGKIWVESRVGEGSTFKFILPKSAKN